MHRLALVAILPLALVGCGSGASSKATPAAPAKPVSTGCGHASSPGTTVVTVHDAGRTRLARVHVPNGDAHGARLALVLDLHGSGSTASQQEALSGMDATADADSFVVAYPQAAIPAGSGYDWDVPGQPLVGGAPVPAHAPDDVAFLEHVVTTLERTDCVEPLRVYATGLSGGGRMASQLACDASRTVAAVAPVAGLRFPSPCNATRAVPVAAFHGTADPVDPYGGNGQAYWTYSVPVAAQRWAAHDGCASAPVTSTPHAGVTLVEYARCRDGASVQLYAVRGEGHEWPGGPTLPASVTRVLGPQSDAVSANAVMWQFFSSHPLR